MQSFQERFKHKSSVIGKTGEVDIKSNKGIVKAQALQIHSPIIKSSARNIIENSSHYEKSPSKIPSSASPSPLPKRENSMPKRQVSQAPPLSLMSSLEDPPLFKQKISDFVPYSITDYSFIKTNKYYELGGLGSSTIGTEEWERRKKISEKRKNYAKRIVESQRDNFDDTPYKSLNKSTVHARNSTSLT